LFFIPLPKPLLETTSSFGTTMHWLVKKFDLLLSLILTLTEMGKITSKGNGLLMLQVFPVFEIVF
jgi:hypothetical protein